MWFAVFGFAAAYGAIALLKHWQFNSSYDLAIYDQAVWHLSRFEPPASSVRGMTNLFGDHFHPVIVLFAPLFWIVPAAETLLTAQAVLLAISIIPVFVYSRHRLPRGAAVAIAVAYGLFWGMQQTAAFDVHEAAFAPLAVASLILAMERTMAVVLHRRGGRVKRTFTVDIGALLGKRRGGLLLEKT